MSRLLELEVGEGANILIEVNEGVAVPRGSAPAAPINRRIGGPEQAVPFDSLAETLRGFAQCTIAALGDLERDRAGQIDQVRIQFGVSLGGESGVPFVTAGATPSALQVTIQWRPPRPHSAAEDGSP